MKHDYGKWRCCEGSRAKQPRVNLCKVRRNHMVFQDGSLSRGQWWQPIVGQARQERCYISMSISLKDKDFPAGKPFLPQAEAGDLAQHHRVEKDDGKCSWLNYVSPMKSIMGELTLEDTRSQDCFTSAWSSDNFPSLCKGCIRCSICFLFISYWTLKCLND